MAFKAVLDLAGTEFSVEDCNFSLSQQTDHKMNKPTAKVAPSSIAMELKVDSAKIKDLWKWGMNDDEKRDGTIKFYKIDEDASLFELSFKEGFCTSFSYHMSSHGSSDMTVHVDVSSRVMELEGEGFDLEW